MNKVVLIGRLTRNPDLNYAAGSGTAVCKLSLAVARPFKKDETDFINCIAFGKSGETIAQYVTKGRQLAVTGAIRTGNYTDKEGIKRYTSDVIVDSFEFMGNGQGNNNQNGPSNECNQENSFYDDVTPVDNGDCPF